MPYCPKCGKEVPADAAYCYYCGSPIRALAPTPPPTSIKKGNTNFQKVAKTVGAIACAIIVIMVILIIPGPTPTPTPTPILKPTPDISALYAIMDQVYDKFWEENDARIERENYTAAYQITYEIEELLEKFMEEYSAIVEKLPHDMSHGFKVWLASKRLDVWIDREFITFDLMIDLSLKAMDDPKFLSEYELALNYYENLMPKYRQSVDDLQKLYEQDPKASEEWGFINSTYIDKERKWAVELEDTYNTFLEDFKQIKAYWEEIGGYTPPEQKIIKSSSEIWDRLMALCRTKSAEGIIPSDLASFFDKFDFNGDGKISLNEGQEFFYWVEANIKYRFDDENDKKGLEWLRAGLITQAQLGDGRSGDEYWQKPYETFIERYGDCEDMAILEAAFYNYFGVEAYVAGVDVDKPGVVNHALCIAKIGDDLDEYVNYLGKLNYYELDSKYFMFVDNAYSNAYGYISGETVGVTVHFTLYERYTLEQICVELWCPPAQGATGLNGKWEGTFQILTSSRIKVGEGEWVEFGGAEAAGSISIRIRQEGSEVEGWIDFDNIQESIKFDNTAFGEYMVLFSTLEQGIYECWGTINADGSLTITGFLRYAPFKANIAGDVMSANFEETFVSELDELITLKTPDGKIVKVIGPTETKDIVTFNLVKVSDEPPPIYPPPPQG